MRRFLRAVLCPLSLLLTTSHADAVTTTSQNLAITVTGARATSCAMSGAQVTLSPGANIQTAINNAGAGTTLIFAPGTYGISSTINLASNMALQGQSGAQFQYAGAGAVMFNGNAVSNINICGINFDGGQTGGSGTFPNAVIFLANANNVHITSNTFTHNSQQSDLSWFNSDGIYFQGNTSGPNEFQPVTGHITDSYAHSNIYITDNKFSNFYRMGIEIVTNSTSAQAWNNAHIDRNTFSDWLGVQQINSDHIAISFAAPSAPSTHNTVWGNIFNGTSGYGQWGIEIGTRNTSIEQNTMTNVDFPVVISDGTGSEIENNSFTNYSTQYNVGPFGKDGGYYGTEWIGTNLWNGTSVTGWPGHSYGTQPPVNQPSMAF
jgi:hypothetical protein